MHGFVGGLIVGAIVGSYVGAFVLALMVIGGQSDDRGSADRRRASDTGGVPRLFMGNERPGIRPDRTQPRHGVSEPRRLTLHDDNIPDTPTDTKG